MRAQAILFTGPGQAALGDIAIPEPGRGEVLIETSYTCISPGTEMRCLAGKQPGAPAWPFIPGYALAGIIAAQGPGATLPVGTPVFCSGTEKADANRCWGGHVGHAVRAEASVFPIPAGIDLLDAALAKLAAICYHGVRMSRPLPHERIAVIGLGPIGQLAARLHAATGARVVCGDVAPERVAIARGAGLEAIQVEGDLASAFRPVLPDGADVIVDATGAPAVLAQAIALARDVAWHDATPGGARLLVQGSYPADFGVPYQAAFMKELSILITRDQQPQDTRTALELMQRGKLRVRDLITDVRAPADAPRTYAELVTSRSAMTFVFEW
jgi:3-hydroxyethyl bacteriochlorophyllide a dehydrogenase